MIRELRKWLASVILGRTKEYGDECDIIYVPSFYRQSSILEDGYRIFEDGDGASVIISYQDFCRLGFGNKSRTKLLDSAAVHNADLISEPGAEPEIRQIKLANGEYYKIVTFKHRLPTQDEINGFPLSENLEIQIHSGLPDIFDELDHSKRVVE